MAAGSRVGDSEVRQFRAHQRRLLRLMLAISRFHQKVMGMGSLELHIMQMLWEREREGVERPIARELAEILRVDKAALSRAVATLMKRELVDSEAREGDNRQLLLGLTKEGAEMAQEWDAAAQEANRKLLEGVSAPDREKVVDGIARFVDVIEAALEANAKLKSSQPLETSTPVVRKA